MMIHPLCLQNPTLLYVLKTVDPTTPKENKKKRGDFKYTESEPANPRRAIIMPDISITSDAEQKRRLQQKLEDHLTSFLHLLVLKNPLCVEGASLTAATLTVEGSIESKPNPSATQPQPSRLASGTNGYTQRRQDGEMSGDTDSTAHIASQQSAIVGTHSSTNASGSYVPKVEQFSYSNYTFWYMSA